MTEGNRRSSLIKRTAWVFALAVLMASGAAPALASQSVKKHAESTISIKQASKQYLADVSPFTMARAAYVTAFSGWYRDKEPPALSPAFVDPFVAACRVFQRKLGSQKWPHSARSEVRALAASIAVVAGDVGRLPSVDALTASAWGNNLTRDSAVSTSDAKKVRADLGLPPAA